MFGKAGLGGLMKQAQQMQENMKKAQAKLAETEIEGEAGNGLVKITMTCAHEVRKIDISPDLIQKPPTTKKCSKTSSSPPSNPPVTKPKKPQTKQWAHSPKDSPPEWATSSADPRPSFPRRRESRT